MNVAVVHYLAATSAVVFFKNNMVVLKAFQPVLLFRNGTVVKANSTHIFGVFAPVGKDDSQN